MKARPSRVFAFPCEFPRQSSTSSAGTSRGKRPARQCQAIESEGAKNPLKSVRGDRNRYGCAYSYALVLAMRYVIVIIAFTFFLIWDGLYNQGAYLDYTVRELSLIHI